MAGNPALLAAAPDAARAVVGHLAFLTSPAGRGPDAEFGHRSGCRGLLIYTSYECAAEIASRGCFGNLYGQEPKRTSGSPDRGS